MASSSSYHHSAPASSSSRSFNYDVFISFRGEDTRKTFVDYLYSTLVDRLISTYKDDVTLPRGASISPSLFKAIEGSQIAVIVFSENYADSSWCLEELAHIMKCRDERKLIVMPIFYCVDPSEVRKQKGKYAEAFDKHEIENISKVESWRQALVDACGIAGWEPKNIANGHEMEAIKEIVNTISSELISLTSDVDDDLVGMRVRMQELEAQLKIGSGGVRMVGIWGVGGSGKTTLATSLYMKISQDFQGHCIVENIREETSKFGLKILQEKIISRLLKTEIKLQSVQEGIRILKSRLSRSNVLILLDDVDHINQLEALAGSHNWFGSGSRIIITTRNEHLLKSHIKVDQVCPVTLLAHDEAIQLFNKRAYDAKYHVNNYETLSLSVVSYAAGLPLALIVLGSFLCGRDEEEWRSTLARLKDNPEMEIIEKLKISYDGLKPSEKQLFLDIACFFRRNNKPQAMEIFEACGYNPGIGIKVLKEKALITIVVDQFDMHDLIQEMAHYIVKGDDPNNPEKHSRVWEDENIMYLEGATMENHNIEAIQVTHYRTRDVISPFFFKMISNMKKLRWLSVVRPYGYNVGEDDVIHEGPNFLSNELRYICWEGYPKSSLPDSCQLMKLVILRLTYGFSKELWKGYKYLPQLKVLELFKLENLLSTPDFVGLPCLQKLTIRTCKKLKSIHPSLGMHTCLEDICVSFCDELSSFPTIFELGKLKTLDILQCPRLKFPKIEANMKSLVKLSLNQMGIDVLLSSIEENRFGNLTSLHLSYCYLNNKEAKYHALQKLEEFKLTSFRQLEMLSGKDQYRSECLSWLSLVLSQSTSSLRKLDLSGCCLRDGEIPPHIGELSNLRELSLSSNDFSRLDFSLSQLTRLKDLSLRNCKQLIELPELPSSLAILDVSFCSSLNTIGDFYKVCKWLCQVSIRGMNIIPDSNKLLRSMLLGKTIENHSMLLKLEGLDIARTFEPPLVRGTRYQLKLPDNWSNNFCGFLMCGVLKDYGLEVYVSKGIMMKHVTSGIDYEDDVWEESDGDKYTWVFYVSFAKLRHTPWWNSSYKTISIDMNTRRVYESPSNSSESLCSGFGVRLISSKSGSAPTETLSTTQEESEYSRYTPEFEVSHDPSALQISFPNLFAKHYLF